MCIEKLQRFLKRKKRAKILWLIDLENLRINAEMPPPEKYSMVDGFDRLTKQIAQEVGEIVDVLAFAPPHAASLFGADLRKLGFHIISCPRVRTKEGEDIDSTDSVLIERGIRMINNIPDLTHLCIGSGDKDFSPLVREAMRKGLKIIVVAGNLRSLASNLINLADKRPDGGKMVYLFSPTEG